MIWRKFKLEWSYAIGELFIVVVGVLIALAIDQWNDNRLERLEEIDAVSRILVDLQTDLKDFDFRLKSVAAKEESLLRVKAALAGDTEIDPVVFLTDIIIGADFGWNQGFAQRSTYDNLMASGRLGIIQDADIRVQISDNYRLYQDEHIRIEERETDYPALSYRLVPRRGHKEDIEHIALERTIEPGLSDSELLELVDLVQRSSIHDHVTAELNLARFIREVELALQSRAVALMSELERYQTRIE
jgi:hypothetical protein